MARDSVKESRPAGTDAGRIDNPGEAITMSQGPRGGWVRAVFAGVGVMFCAGLVGCTGLDKPKDKQATNTKQPGAGLPGTPRLPGAPGTGVAGAAGTGAGMGGLQPIGGTNYNTVGTGGRTPGGTGFSTTGGPGMPAVSGTSYPTGPAGGSSVAPPVGPAGAGAGASGTWGGSAAGGASSGSGFSPPNPQLTDFPVPPSAPDAGSRGGPVVPPGPVSPYR